MAFLLRKEVANMNYKDYVSDIKHIAGTPYLQVERSPFSVDELEIFKYILAEQSQAEFPPFDPTRSNAMSYRLEENTDFGVALANNFTEITRTLDDGSDTFFSYPYDKPLHHSQFYRVAKPGYISESIRCSPPGEDYPIHKDSTSKLLTCLIYLEPEVSDGTFFHTAMETEGVEHPWVPNTGYIFKGGYSSYHSYRNTTKNRRTVYMLNLYETNPFKVSKTH